MKSNGGNQPVLLKLANGIASRIDRTASLLSSSIHVLRAFREVKIQAVRQAKAIYGGSAGCRARPLFLAIPRHLRCAMLPRLSLPLLPPAARHSRSRLPQRRYSLGTRCDLGPVGAHPRLHLPRLRLLRRPPNQPQAGLAVSPTSAPLSRPPGTGPLLPAPARTPGPQAAGPPNRRPGLPDI